MDYTIGVDAHLNEEKGEIAEISGVGKEMSSMLLCSLQRNASQASDTYNGDIHLLEADFHYEKDTIGSREENIK